MRRAMMRPMSPEPRMTTSLPGMRPSRLVNFWAVPAVKMPGQRSPGVPREPRGRSRQPMQRITALAWICSSPFLRETQVTTLSAETSRTMVSV